VGLRAGLDTEVREKSFAPAGDRTPTARSSSPYSDTVLTERVAVTINALQGRKYGVRRTTQRNSERSEDGIELAQMTDLRLVVVKMSGSHGGQC
jgi:hypothetical protein